MLATTSRSSWASWLAEHDDIIIRSFITRIMINIQSTQYKQGAVVAQVLLPTVPHLVGHLVGQPLLIHTPTLSSTTTIFYLRYRRRYSSSTTTSIVLPPPSTRNRRTGCGSKLEKPVVENHSVKDGSYSYRSYRTLQHLSLYSLEYSVCSSISVL